MPTSNPRINVTFEPATVRILTRLAKERGQSVSCLTKELVLEALDRQEDMLLSNLAEQRDSTKQKTLRHDKVW